MAANKILMINVCETIVCAYDLLRASRASIYDSASQTHSVMVGLRWSLVVAALSVSSALR